MRFQIDPDIKNARTLPATFYQSSEVYQKLIERILVPSWQLIGDESVLLEHNCYPFELLPGSVSEPLLLTRDKKKEVHCLSNVCTHRGKVLVEKPSWSLLLSCGYHGRCFHLDGRFRSMPEFSETENFPSQEDNLPKLTIERLGAFWFTSIAPKIDFEMVIQPIRERMYWFDFDKLILHKPSSKTYETSAHWALYCDNYLEGFHVPFVHPGLGEQLDYKEYSTEIFDYCNLQLGIASKEAACFDLPKDSPDYGKRIYAYYWWIYPNLMLNIYTWGVSVNIVEPLGMNKTRVVFKSYLLDGKDAEEIRASGLEDTEMEDEAVVESVQLGVHSRLYRYGRFSATREQGVHHFHRLLAKELNQ